MWQEIGSGTVLSSPEIADLLGQVPGDTRVQLTLDLTASPGAWVVNELQNVLSAAGVPGVHVSTGSPVLNISWLHNPGVPYRGARVVAMDPFTAVAIILASLAVIAIVVLGWRLYQDVPTVLKPAVIIGGLAVVGIIAYALARSKTRSGG
jgi:hypothetical protein